jgi:hypothetical protein
MLVKLSSDKTMSEVATALQAAVQANHFGVMQVHNLRETVMVCIPLRTSFLPKQESSVSSKNHRIPGQARNDGTSCDKEGWL